MKKIIISAIIAVVAIIVIAGRHEQGVVEVSITEGVATTTETVAVTTPETKPVAQPTKPEVKEVTVTSSNPAAAQLFALTNADRVANGLKPLAYDLTVERAAQGRANEIAADGYFSHVSASELRLRMRHWLDTVGSPWKHGGENLAEGYVGEKVQEAFMSSPTHRANILKPEYTHVGIATSRGICSNQEACGFEYGTEVQFTVVIFISK